MASEPSEHTWEIFTSLQEAKGQLDHFQRKDSFTEEKNLFECMKAEREQAQHQLYGMTDLFVRITLTGLKLS